MKPNNAVPVGVEGLRDLLRAVARRVMRDGSPCYCNERIQTEADHLPTCRKARAALASQEPAATAEDWFASVRKKFNLPIGRDPNADHRDYWTGYADAINDAERQFGASRMCGLERVLAGTKQEASDER